MEHGVRRWLVDISCWDPSPDHFSFLVSLLPAQEGAIITRKSTSSFCMLVGGKFVTWRSKKQDVIAHSSIEAEYRAVAQTSCEMIWVKIFLQEIVLSPTSPMPIYFDDAAAIFIANNAIFHERTKHIKEDNFRSAYPSFNFNVSHSGSYVGITSDAFFLVGLDIVSIDVPRNATIFDFIKNFKSHFTNLEWSNITKAITAEDILLNFYRYWCLKEAYVKAVGTGLGFSLSRLEFLHDTWENIVLYVDGIEARDWEFWICQLDDRHWASFARGTPSCKFLRVHSPQKQEFSYRTVEQLIPASKLNFCSHSAENEKAS